MPEVAGKIFHLYITFFGLGGVKYIGKPAIAALAAAFYLYISNIGILVLWDTVISFRYLQLVLAGVILLPLVVQLAGGRLPDCGPEPAVNHFSSVLIMLYSPFNVYTIPWVLSAVCLYFAFNEASYAKKIKKKLRNEEKFLLFSYFINNIISVIAAIILHIIYGGYRALPLVGLFFGY